MIDLEEVVAGVFEAGKMGLGFLVAIGAIDALKRFPSRRIFSLSSGLVALNILIMTALAAALASLFFGQTHLVGWVGYLFVGLAAAWWHWINHDSLRSQPAEEPPSPK